MLIIWITNRIKTEAAAPLFCLVKGGKEMQISSSRTRITPEGPFFPCYLLGHAIRTEKATGVADDLWATALVLKIE